MRRLAYISLAALVAAGAVALLIALCSNDPWPPEFADTNTLFVNYSSAIKTLDPATSYYVHESAILDNIVDAPLEYDYEARPFELKPLLLSEMPSVAYYDAEGRRLDGEPAAGQVARTEYLLHLRPGILFQPHPCFGEKKRQLTALDFKVGLARVADPRVASPVYSTFKSFLLDFETTSQAIADDVAELEQREPGRNFERLPVLPDYRAVPMPCFEELDSLTFRIILRRKYPQALYWMATHFFAPVPWEALEYYHDPARLEDGTVFRNNPVGTGEFMLREFDPNNRIILVRNPLVPQIRPDGLDAVVFQFERESIPAWLKFLQGYYDRSGIPTDMFEAAVDMNPGGQLELSGELAKLNLRLQDEPCQTIFYFGFNMLDADVGGISPEKAALRQAISIVLDYHEYIDIFQNGRGIPAPGPIPVGIFGAAPQDKSGVNPFIDTWDEKTGTPRRRTLEDARRLMAQAGFPEGRRPDGTPLRLYLDHAASGVAGFKAQFQWLRTKFQLLGIELEERPSDLNRWRDKLRQGNWQLIFNKGWVADYPDPENFLFLFASGNATVASGGRGANYVNYSSPEFDEIFQRLETLPNGPERLALIQQATRILQRDAPCCWGFFQVKTILTQEWLHNYRYSDLSHNGLKHLSLDWRLRTARQREWNRLF